MLSNLYMDGRNEKENRRIKLGRIFLFARDCLTLHKVSCVLRTYNIYAMLYNLIQLYYVCCVYWSNEGGVLFRKVGNYAGGGYLKGPAPN